MQMCSCVAKVMNVSQLEVFFCSLPTLYEGNHCLLNDYLSRHRCEGEPDKRALRLSDLPLLGIRSVGVNYLMMNSVILNFNTQEQRFIISQCTAPVKSLQTSISSSNAAEDFLQTCSGEKTMFELEMN